LHGSRAEYKSAARNTGRLWVGILALLVAACGSAETDERLGESRENIDVGQGLVIRQIYGDVPNGPYRSHFVELFNRGGTPVSLAGLSFQGSNGDTNFNRKGDLPAVSLAPGQSFLISGYTSGNGANLPTPDLDGSVGAVAPASAPAKVAIVRSTTNLPCGSTLSPCTTAQLALMVDLVGLGPTSLYETAPAAAVLPGKSLQRKLGGTQDTNNNANDFELGLPQPRNMAMTKPPPLVGLAPPPDPTSGTTGTSFDSVTKFIYDPTNPNAIQTGVMTGTIEPARAGWITGSVFAADGAPLSGVVVNVAGEIRFGQTQTRADGRFDLIVNGGSTFTIRFAKSGYFPADRQAYVGWEETSLTKKVVLLHKDASPATTVSLGSGALQSVVGSVSTDAAGPRTPVLMVPAGITATIPGSATPTSLTLRLTEYTQGSDGPARMPAPLPPTSGYTYAVEISADEAIAAGAEVKFSGDVFFYVTNFLAVPVGQSVPSGYYDRTARAWKATTTAAGADKNGTVIKITGTSGLMVTIDSGGVVTLSDAERSQLYQHIQQGTYKVGDELWRMPIDHLTPYDFNFGRQVALDLGPAAVSTPPETQCEHSVAGSIIGCESQSLGEVSAVAG